MTSENFAFDRFKMENVGFRFCTSAIFLLYLIGLKPEQMRTVNIFQKTMYKWSVAWYNALSSVIYILRNFATKNKGVIYKPHQVLHLHLNVLV